MVEEIKLVESDFKTSVKAIITDAASDCRKARRLAVEEMPHIVSLDCFAHQVHSAQACITAHARSLFFTATAFCIVSVSSCSTLSICKAHSVNSSQHFHSCI